MSIAVIGAGYVGLTTAACLAHLGHEVVCADIDAERVARLRKGEVPILEDGLPALISRGSRVASGCRSSSVRPPRPGAPTSCSSACRRRRATTARPTSVTSRRVAREIAPVLAPRAVVVNKSTVPVGSTRFVQRVLAEAGAPSEHVTVASNPEFLREGQAVHDFLHPDRIVIGCEDPRVGGARLRALPRRARAGARHRPRVGGDDQVRVERVPRHQDLVHQRDREPVRGGRRRRARSRDRHGLRHAHRLPVPAPRPGLRRLVLPEGRRRAAPHRAQAGYDFQLLDGVVGRQPRPARPHRRQGRAAAGRRRRPLDGVDDRGAGASRSRPTPTTCATRRRS